MVSRIRPFEVIRGLFLVIALILSIPTLVLLVEFMHNNSLQGKALVFKILGLVVAPLTFALMPSLILHWRLVEHSFSVVSEMSIISAVWCLWLAFLILGNVLQDELYPVPGYIRHQKGINGCQFLPPGPEVHRCHSLIASSQIPIGIVAILFDYLIMLLISSIIIYRRGNAIWTQPAKEAFSSLEWNWPGAKRSRPSPERA